MVLLNVVPSRQLRVESLSRGADRGRVTRLPGHPDAQGGTLGAFDALGVTVGWLRRERRELQYLSFIAGHPGNRGDPHSRPIAIGILIIRPTSGGPGIEPRAPAWGHGGGGALRPADRLEEIRTEVPLPIE